MELVAQSLPDAVVLDIGMPGIDGLEVCRRLRRLGNRVPILILTARDAVGDRIDGLDAARTTTWSSHSTSASSRRACAHCCVAPGPRRRSRRRWPSPRARRLGRAPATASRWWAARERRFVELTRTEYQLLELLMRNPRQVLTHSVIYERVWGYDFGPTSNALRVYVGYLRRKLEQAGARAADPQRAGRRLRPARALSAAMPGASRRAGLAAIAVPRARARRRPAPCIVAVRRPCARAACSSLPSRADVVVRADLRGQLDDSLHQRAGALARPGAGGLGAEGGAGGPAPWLPPVTAKPAAAARAARGRAARVPAARGRGVSRKASSPRRSAPPRATCSSSRPPAPSPCPAGRAPRGESRSTRRDRGDRRRRARRRAQRPRRRRYPAARADAWRRRTRRGDGGAAAHRSGPRARSARCCSLAIGAAGILLAAGLGVLVARTALVPIARFTRNAEQLTGGLDLAQRLEVAGDDELARLAASFNAALDALERSVDAQRQLIADAGHELRTPIASLRANIQVLQRRRAPLRRGAREPAPRHRRRARRAHGARRRRHRARPRRRARARPRRAAPR